MFWECEKLLFKKSVIVAVRTYSPSSRKVIFPPCAFKMPSNALLSEIGLSSFVILHSTGSTLLLP